MGLQLCRSCQINALEPALRRVRQEQQAGLMHTGVYTSACCWGRDKKSRQQLARNEARL